jgi:diaminopimelate epimerase
MIEFYKMSGSGNDFIIIDNRDLSLNVGDLPAFSRRVCERKISVGADGLFLIEPSKTVDFKWQFFNSDGSVAEMCGNGSRCVARYAYLKGIAPKKMSFETLAGIISAEVNDDVVKVRLTDPSPVQSIGNLVIDDCQFVLDIVDTGVPHAVTFVENPEPTQFWCLRHQNLFALFYKSTHICSLENTVCIRKFSFTFIGWAARRVV